MTVLTFIPPERPATPSLRQKLIASRDMMDVLDAINQLEETVCGIYRDAEAEAYSGQLQPWALALKVRGRLTDAFSECGERLNAARAIPHSGEPIADPITPKSQTTGA